MASTKQTRLFMLILLVALASMYGSLILVHEIQESKEYDAAMESLALKKYTDPKIEPAFTEAQERTVDSSSWKTYRDLESPLSFKYPPDWEVIAENYTADNQLYRILITPEEKRDAITVYVSEKNYFAIAGLPTEKVSFNGASALSIDHIMMAVKNGKYYYTLYAGNTLELKPEFEALTKTIKFK